MTWLLATTNITDYDNIELKEKNTNTLHHELKNCKINHKLLRISKKICGQKSHARVKFDWIVMEILWANNEYGFYMEE